MKKITKNSPKVLGLDVSTKTIGWALFDVLSEELLELTHISPKIKTKKGEIVDRTKVLLAKSDVFMEKLANYKDMGITKVIIEEPLLGSNNINTVGVLLRFNGYISRIVYDQLGIIPNFISTYDARKNAFPELFAPNKNGKHVLFGAFDRGVDKKEVIWKLVAEREPQIAWSYSKVNVLKKECYDMSDAYACALGGMRALKIW